MIKNILVAWLYIAGLLISQVSSAGDGTCAELSRACVDGPSTKMISGEPVTRDCWRYEAVYQCASSIFHEDSCQALRDQGCGQIDLQCVEYSDLDPSKCILYDKKFQCKVSDGVTQPVLNCGNQQFCADGNCFDASAPPDADFGMAVAGMEVLRESGNYMDPNTLQLFTGKDSKCSIKLFGLGNCCKKDTRGGGMSNASLPAQLGVSAVMSVGSETVKMIGNNLMYDTLFTGDGMASVVSGLTDALSAGIDTSGFSPSIGYLGMSVGFGAAPVGAGVVSAQLGTSGFYVAFDPTSFAISIAVMVVMEMLACDEEEGVLALKRGANLCISLGSYCSHKVLGACITKKQSYCCYNSKIAKIINIAGRTQLGLGFGSAKHPNCAGLTIAQVQSIDFSQVDFSEVIGDLQANIKTPTNATNRATTKINSYFAP